MAGQRRGLVAHPLLEVAVAADHEDVVVGDLGSEAGAQVRLGERDADAVGEALTERPGRDLDTGGVAVLGVSRGAGLPLPERAQVVEGEPEPGEIEERVQEHRRVPVGQHETVTVGPVGVARVVAQDPGEQHVRERGQGHRGSGVSRVGLLDGVHGQSADDIDPTLFEIGRHRAAPLVVARSRLIRSRLYHDARDVHPVVTRWCRAVM